MQCVDCDGVGTNENDTFAAASNPMPNRVAKASVGPVVRGQLEVVNKRCSTDFYRFIWTFLGDILVVVEFYFQYLPWCYYNMHVFFFHKSSSGGIR